MFNKFVSVKKIIELKVTRTCLFQLSQSALRASFVGEGGVALTDCWKREL